MRGEGGTRESDRARAEQSEDVMERGKGGEMDEERTRGERVSERTGMMWRKRVGGERSGEFPCPVQRKWA